MNRKQPRHWPLIAVVAISVFCAFSTGAYIATKFVSPCVCIYATASQVQ